MKRGFIQGFAAFGLVASTASAARAEPAPFRVHQVQGLRFELRLPNGQTKFRIGETIPLRLAFSNVGSQTLALDTFENAAPSMAQLAFFSAQPSQGVRDLRADSDRSGGFGFVTITMNGREYGLDQPVVLAKKPTELPVVLNEFLRFDRPGTYQLRARTPRVLVVPPGQKMPTSALESTFTGPQVVSSPVTIQIMAADPKWQHAQVAAWRQAWEQRAAHPLSYSTGEPVKPLAATDLRFLNTREAALAMIERLGDDQFPGTTDSESDYWRLGFLSFSDRSWLLGAMSEAVKRPAYPVTLGFLKQFVELKNSQPLALAPRTATEKASGDAGQQAILSVWKLAYDSLSHKKARARAMTVHALAHLATEMDEPAIRKNSQIKQRWPRLRLLVAQNFNLLPLTPQQDLLSFDLWPHFKSVRMARPLRAAWNIWSFSKQEEGDDWGDRLVCRLFEVAPHLARPILLGEMRASHPRLNVETLSLLPPRPAFALDAVWWKHLQSPDADQNLAAQLIARYASPKLKPKVQHELQVRQNDGTLTKEVNQALRHYLNRVR